FHQPCAAVAAAPRTSACAAAGSVAGGSAALAPASASLALSSAAGPEAAGASGARDSGDASPGDSARCVAAEPVPGAAPCQVRKTSSRGDAERARAVSAPLFAADMPVSTTDL